MWSDATPHRKTSPVFSVSKVMETSFVRRFGECYVRLHQSSYVLKANISCLIMANTVLLQVCFRKNNQIVQRKQTLSANRKIVGSIYTANKTALHSFRFHLQVELSLKNDYLRLKPSYNKRMKCGATFHICHTA